MASRRLAGCLVASAIIFPAAARADEVVSFTNGAEMTVKSHVVDQATEMVKLDLGGNNSISFPINMVDKIVNAGKNVFLNPVYHPQNQAIAGVPGGRPEAGSAGSAVADTTIRGSGPSAGFRPRQVAPVDAMASGGSAGARRPSDSVGSGAVSTKGSPRGQRFRLPNYQAYDPEIVPPPGTVQTIAPPNANKVMTPPRQVSIRAIEGPNNGNEPPPSDSGAGDGDAAPAEDPSQGEDQAPPESH